MVEKIQKIQEQNNFQSSLIMMVGLCLGLYFFTFDTIGFDFTYFPGDLGDGRLNLYFLEHAHKFFSGKLTSFWNAPFMYPEQNVIAYSDNLLGSAPIYSFFRAIGLDIYHSYQWWFIVVSALNYICTFYFLKYLFKNNYAAVLGAFIFAFSIALQSQLMHAQTFPRYAIPLAFLMAVKFSHELKPKYFFYTLLFLIYQIYCGIYLGFMLAVPIGLYLLLIILKDIFYSKKMVNRISWYFKITLSIMLNGLILLPLMIPYMERKISPSFEHFKQISNSVPTITSHFFSCEGSFLWNFMSKIGLKQEIWWNHQLFAGGIATIALIVAVYCMVLKLFRTRFRLDGLSTPLLLILTGSMTFFLFLRFKSITAYIFLYYLPGFSAMRLLTRIINIELIFFSIATAFVFVLILRKKSKYSNFLFILALVLVIVDNYSSKSYKTEVSVAKKRTSSIESTFANIPHGAIVSYEPRTMTSSGIDYQIDAMLTSQKFDLITLNGYTATCPGDFGSYWEKPNAQTRNYWLGGKKLTKDTLYIVKGKQIVEKVAFAKLQENMLSYEEKRMNEIIQYIKTDEKWMKQIQNKANENNVSIDSMLIIDAKWMLENEN